MNIITAQWWLPAKKTCFARRKNRGFGIAHWFSFRKYPKVHRPRSQSPLHFDCGSMMANSLVKIISLPLAFASWRHARALAACLLVKITFTLLPTNCFISTTTNSMKCLVNWIPRATENPRSFEKYPIPPQGIVQYSPPENEEIALHTPRTTRLLYC